MTPEQPLFDHGWRRYAAAFAVVAFAAALRIWPLQALGTSLVWLTFYPAVMVVAIYGGLGAGLLATGLACLTAMFFGPLLVDAAFIRSTADQLGMAVFIFNGTLMSSVAEAMRRANVRAKRAQEQAENSQAQAEAAQAQAEAANRAKSVFLATMSHELRTPLNAILGFSDLMRGDASITADQRTNLDIINRSGQHLLSLINDVLDMAKIEAGQIVVAIKPFEIVSMVGDTVEMLRVRAAEKGLQLWLEQASEFPRYVKADEEKIRQVIVNLLGNAIKYTRQGGVTLRLGIRAKEAAPRIVIEVEDSGIGISKTDQARIFEPFVQVGKPATQKGTGLGLAIVREFVELMGGRISVESEPENGSIFRVELPVEIAAESEVLPPEPVKGRAIGLTPGQGECRILIVEDQEENQLLLRRLLEDAGCKVMLAQNGAEGVDMFQSFHPHFIWMDRRMPVMDGLEATRRIRALEGGDAVKIVAVSASVFSDQRAETLAQGMDDFVRKPYRPAEIFDCLERQLGVRFLYAAADVDAAAVQSTFSAAAVGRLSEALRRDLADALVNGNTERISELTRHIAQEDAGLGDALARHFDHFDYLPVLQALESTGTQPQRTT